MSPGRNKEILHVLVGGGPPSREVAAEINDLKTDRLHTAYPSSRCFVRLTYAMKSFEERPTAKVYTEARIKMVEVRHLVLEKDGMALSHSAVWATRNKVMCPFEEQKDVKHGGTLPRLLTDPRLRILLDENFERSGMNENTALVAHIGKRDGVAEVEHEQSDQAACLAWKKWKSKVEQELEKKRYDLGSPDGGLFRWLGAGYGVRTY
ncbi:hypothetical protein B0O99DRAFT_681014 [Bisporella sp. PMI_857]|nr:hypothetical protein B0O99DRAFT_681014 [Bisporella sp. PMI_857]